MIKIAQVTAHLVWPIRHQVMYPDEDFDTIKLAEDEQGIHLGLFAEEELVSVISLFINGDELQFRKFATRRQYQGKGYGSQLIEHMIKYAKGEKIHRIWCNARRSAARFYSKFGFRETAERFRKNQIEYVIMELTTYD